ncbi:hypothetical protein [Aquibium sp. ELW1220]|jgi:hypothetical protein|uniref:hypothetical protein n=1 Tax=Aquibium sp. ELW1220 TaxID=2976766 RepID=UPI0025AF60E7|nr:hypothetical protein [Aquibium sp. ELW1220]MDN2581100.1 hypothetical protein [Aquibium sp. ELW1220]
MSSGYIILFELVLVLGLALVFGVRELRNLRRFDRERAERNRLAAGQAGNGADASPTDRTPGDRTRD